MSDEQSTLPRFMILIYEREAPASALAAPPTVLEAHMHLPRQIAETGARIIEPFSTWRGPRQPAPVNGPAVSGPMPG